MKFFIKILMCLMVVCGSVNAIIYIKCFTNEECPSDMYCHKDNCNSTQGFCAFKPDYCIQLYKPVCGCDGKTYYNECAAHSAGINVAYQGKCDDSSSISPVPVTCFPAMFSFSTLTLKIPQVFIIDVMPKPLCFSVTLKYDTTVKAFRVVDVKECRFPKDERPLKKNDED